MKNSKRQEDKWEDYPPQNRFVRLATAAYLKYRKRNSESLTEMDQAIISRAAKVAEMFDYQHDEWHGRECRLCRERELLAGFPCLFDFLESSDALSEEKGISLGAFQMMVMNYCGRADEDEKPIRFSRFCQPSTLKDFFQSLLDDNELFSN